MEKVRIRERWSGFYHKRLDKNSLNLHATLIDLLPPQPLKLWLGDQPSMGEMTAAPKGMSRWKAAGPDGFPTELLKTTTPDSVHSQRPRQ